MKEVFYKYRCREIGKKAEVFKGRFQPKMISVYSRYTKKCVLFIVNGNITTLESVHNDGIFFLIPIEEMIYYYVSQPWFYYLPVFKIKDLVLFLINGKWEVMIHYVYLDTVKKNSKDKLEFKVLTMQYTSSPNNETDAQ